MIEKRYFTPVSSATTPASPSLRQKAETWFFVNPRASAMVAYPYLESRSLQICSFLSLVIQHIPPSLSNGGEQAVLTKLRIAFLMMPQTSAAPEQLCAFFQSEGFLRLLTGSLGVDFPGKRKKTALKFLGSRQLSHRAEDKSGAVMMQRYR